MLVLQPVESQAEPASEGQARAPEALEDRREVLVFRGACLEEALLAAAEALASGTRAPGRMLSGTLEVRHTALRGPAPSEPNVTVSTLGTTPGPADTPAGPAPAPAGPASEPGISGQAESDSSQVPSAVDSAPPVGEPGPAESDFDAVDRAFFEGYVPEEPLTSEELLAMVDPGAAARLAAGKRRRQAASSRLAAFLHLFLLG